LQYSDNVMMILFKWNLANLGKIYCDLISIITLVTDNRSIGDNRTILLKMCFLWFMLFCIIFFRSLWS
jgi:hypothetical protein